MDEEIYLPTYEEVMNKENSLPKYEDIKTKEKCDWRSYILVTFIFLLFLIVLPVILALKVDKNEN